MKKEKEGIFKLKLFVTGMSISSVRAIENIKAITEKYLSNNFNLEIIDIHKNPASLQEFDVIACPTLIKISPGSVKKLIGDLSDEKKVLLALGIREQGSERSLN